MSTVIAMVSRFRYWV